MVGFFHYREFLSLALSIASGILTFKDTSTLYAIILQTNEFHNAKKHGSTMKSGWVMGGAMEVG